MGVALVNLVWRRLAVVTPVLQASWKTLKPHYSSGAIPAAAWQLRQQVNLPHIEPINPVERDLLMHELQDAGVIDEVLRTYERGNAQNLIALCYLQMALHPGKGNTTNSSSSTRQSFHQQTDNILCADQVAAQQADSHFGAIPSLPQSDQLSEDIRSLVARSSSTWVPASNEGLAPSVFRHLTYWPGLLTLFTERLEKIEGKAGGNVEATARLALASARACASTLGEADLSLANLTQSDRTWLQGVLTFFIDIILARGVIIVPTLRSLLRGRDRLDEDSVL